MWIDNALKKEKVAHMFGGVLNIDNVEFSGFSFYSISSIRFSFNIKGIPKVHPKKWDECGYNAISLVLSFDGVKSFNAVGNRLFFICNPKIETGSHIATINIDCNDMKIYCESEFVTIEGITPYIDERWD